MGILSQTTSPRSPNTGHDETAEAIAAAVWRFFSGAPMDGIWKTDATWTHRGVRTTRPDHRAASKWDHLSRWERLGVRWSAVGSAAGVSYAYANDPATTLAWLEGGSLTAACGASSFVAFKTADGLLTWRHRHDWVWPLHVVLSRALDLPEGTKPSSYLRIPQNFEQITGDCIRIEVPADAVVDAGLKALVKDTVTQKLALQDVTFSWKLDSTNHHVVVSQSPRPPSKVLFSDPAIQALVENSPESAPLIGLSHRGSGVAVDLDAESPHVLVSAGTGGGKSVILRTVLSQLLRNGAKGFILDLKRHSHKWARGIPAVEYCRDIADIHDSLVWLGEEGHRRNRIVDDWTGADKDAPVGARMAILLEEVNATVKKLKNYWTKVREKKDPKESPAIEALGEILFMGRAVKMHVLAVGQSITAHSIGGPEMRENFSTRILARYTRNAWNMLVPEVQPAPKATKHIGRAQVVLGGNARETQVCFFTDAEARSWATGGSLITASQGHTEGVDLGQGPVTVTVPRPAGRPEADPTGTFPRVEIPGQGVSVENFVTDMEAVFGGNSDSAPTEKPVTLREAVESGVVTCSLAVARKEANDKARGKEFPPSVGVHGKSSAKLYLPSDLKKWERNRPKSGAKAEQDDE